MPRTPETDRFCLVDILVDYTLSRKVPLAHLQLSFSTLAESSIGLIEGSLEQMSCKAQLDALIGLINRREFIQRLPLVLERLH